MLRHLRISLNPQSHAYQRAAVDHASEISIPVTRIDASGSNHERQRTNLQA